MASYYSKIPSLSACCFTLFMAGLLTGILLLSPVVPIASAGSISLDSNKTTATINPSTTIEYNASKMKDALWNHGIFYVCFSQGTTKTTTASAKASGSSLATKKFSVAFNKGFSWAKVHVAAVDSSTKNNGGKNKRLKSNSGTELSFGSYLSKSKKFYVWISDTGGTQGAISLRGTTKRTVYAGAKTFKNVETITVASQLGAERLTQRQQESSANDVINIPFNWSGKLAHQVPYAEFLDKGVGSSGKHAYYRLNWWQYSDGVTYDGFSPYKLQHDSTTASNLWASVNLAAVGITATPTFKESTYKTKTDKVYRNYNTTLGIRLKAPHEKVLLNTNGGVLKKGSSSYSGSDVSYATKGCTSTVVLPAKGSKTGRDGTSTGYTLSGYTWSSGTNRKNFSTSTVKSTTKFMAFDQASPQTLSAGSASIAVCNNWQMPRFASTNYGDGNTGDMLPSVANAKVTYTANWTPKTFKIHYFIDGIETKTVSKTYDSSYTIDPAPSGSQGWKITKKDGTTASSKGYMPSQDIYVTANTLSKATVKYFINGKIAATYSIPFGSSPLASNPQKGIIFSNNGSWDTNAFKFITTYTENGQGKTLQLDHDSPVNSFGGSLSKWYSDETGSTLAPNSVTVKPGMTLSFHGFTTHTIHFWMDTGALDESSSEKTCCMDERTYRYGTTFTVPTDSSISSKVTRPGCEDWSTSCGTWFKDSEYRSQAESQITCTGDMILYSHNMVKLSYELTNAAKELDAAEGGSYELYRDQDCTQSHSMRSFLPSSSMLRYGQSVAVAGDGVLYRRSGPKSVRSLSSAEGGFLTESGEGELFETLVLRKSTTVFKDWYQGIFDGIITS